MSGVSCAIATTALEKRDAHPNRVLPLRIRKVPGELDRPAATTVTWGDKGDGGCLRSPPVPLEISRETENVVLAPGLVLEIAECGLARHPGEGIAVPAE